MPVWGDFTGPFLQCRVISRDRLLLTRAVPLPKPRERRAEIVPAVERNARAAAAPGEGMGLPA